MTDFVEYIVSEMKSRRLSKDRASALIAQLHARPAAAGQGGFLHPMLHRNTSDLSEQRFSTRFDGQEPFLRDHQVQGQKVLPGVAYLEMVRAAIAQAVPDVPQASIIELRDVMWVQPVVVAERKDVTVALLPRSEAGADAIDYEVYSADAVHSQGQVAFIGRPEAARLDVAAIKARMNRGTFAAAQLYPAYERMGISYGPSHRALSAVNRGDGELLAEINLPASAPGMAEGYVLHPGLMDAALQAPLGFVDDIAAAPDRALLPFALQSVRILSACTPRMFAWLRRSPEQVQQGALTRIDIDLCDAEGRVCVQMRGFAFREVTAPSATPEVGVMYAVPRWEPAALDASKGDRRDEPTRQLMLCGLQGVDSQALQALLPGCRCVGVPKDGVKNAADRYSEAALACFELIRQALDDKSSSRTLVQVAVADTPEDSLLVGLSGLLRTAAIENPRVSAQVVLVPPDISAQELAGVLRAENTRDDVVRHRQGTRQVLRLQEMEVNAPAALPAFKQRGVYLITGGLGGLGLIFAQEILKQAADATIVLTGRSALSDETQQKLEALGGRVTYRPLDVADASQVGQLVRTVVDEQGELNGIIHAAGVRSDSFILKKSAQEFAQVLAPKVAGTLNLDQATRETDLDFLVLFSSGASVMGNSGQADYAAANGFMDQFARHRNELAANGERRGRTLSINWPLWQDGGMGVDAQTQQRIADTSGMLPMQTTTGLQAFGRALAMDAPQVLLVEGDLVKLRRTLLEADTGPAEATPTAPTAPANANHLQQAMQDLLKRTLSAILKYPPNRIDAQAPFEKYGIDSIMTMNLTQALEKIFGALAKTLFFEYRSIAELADYFVRQHPQKVTELVSDTAATPTRSTPAATAVAEKATPVRSKRQADARRFIQPAATDATPIVNDDPIAIVGLSGRYPGAPDVEAYWHNLRDGKDCITEVPASRWDWRKYYSADRQETGHHYSKWGGFIDGVDEFDPRFFGISPREATFMEPQERLFLQHAWMALEDAGETRAALHRPRSKDLPGQAGVYVGVMYSEYQLFGAEALAKGKRLAVPGSYASIANRVSYLLDLHGPSMTVDTMCSSSLTAIHLACQDLKLGRTDVGIAGGVNVSIHPAKYLMISAGQFISSDGHCQSFGVGGDGYIPAEGVGVVVLKRLSDARRDGNPIYGVILGSAINHGGRTNGYSVPNPKAQASVISQALAEAKTSPRHISYVEAHGTGTKLGDPIEIAALTHAFHQDTRDTGFCLIGSAKSNIGHAESAAGIAGLTKVLLQMKHRQVAPSLHSSVLNPHIDFPSTPFIVNQALNEWKRPVVDGRELPRIAGLSSFGAGGSNAHLVIQEWDEPAPALPVVDAGKGPGVVIPLSARTAEQLVLRARDLREHLRAAPADLAAVAHTLQVGREAMDVRMGVIVHTVQELADKLDAYCQGERDIENAWHGAVKHDGDPLSALALDDDFQETVDRWLANRKLPRLVELWVNGLNVDWARLHGDARPRHVSLPPYPFAKERYWIDVAPDVPAVVATPVKTVLHPLLHANTSTFERHSFSSTFEGTEPVLVDGSLGKELPSFACLEMARAALEAVSGEPNSSRRVELRDVRWGRPFAPGAADPLTIELFALDDKHSLADFEICSGAATQESVHCQGQVQFGEGPVPAVLNHLARLRQDAEGSSDRFMLPVDVQSNLLDAGEGIALHPQVLDAALGAVLARLPQRAAAGACIPVSLESLVVMAPTPSHMLAWVRVVSRQDESLRLDVDLCSAQGEVAVQMKGLALQSMEVAAAPRSGVSLADLSVAAVAPRTSAKRQGVQLRELGQVSAMPELRPVGPASKQELVLPAAVPATVPPAQPKQRALSGDRLLQQLKESLAAALYMEPGEIDPVRPFVDLGLDSIVGVEWVKAINKQHGIDLAAARVYDYPNLKELSVFVAGELAKSDAAVPVVETPAPAPVVQPAVPAAARRQVALEPMPAAAQAAVAAPVAAAPTYSRDALVQQLRTTLAAALYMEPSEIDPAKPFVELGLDSIVGVEWVKVLNKKYGLDLAATRVYDYPSLKELAVFLVGELKAVSPPAEVPAAQPAAVVRAAPTFALSSSAEPVALPVAKPASANAYPVLARKPRTPKPAPTEARRHGGSGKIAIIGMSGRYPGAANLRSYWQNLVEGRNAVTEVPASRWDVNRYYDPDPKKPGKIYCKWLGALDDVDCFDPLFFQITPAEAELMDPQHRLFLQESYRAFEDAGYSPKALSNVKCGVYLGIMSSEYAFLGYGAASSSIPITGSSFAIGAARIAYALNLKGPAIPVDTACSSSLVATHLACQALLNGETDMALTGGVTTYLIPESYLGMCQAGMLSPQGQCKAFDDSANGFVPGEGVGALVLKRLEDAERDGDPIYGVILGSAINQDGKTNGITAPSVNSQIQLERDLYERCAIHPETIQYIETHGTGTKLGDPIELEALSTVFKEKTSRKNFCGLGSVKSNLGHTSAAAGVASIHKVLLGMRHGAFVPTLHVQKENALFDFGNSPFYISRETRPWLPEGGDLRRAAVSSFGFSGTNAHLVIEEYRPSPERARRLAAPVAGREEAIVLSARTSAQLKQKARDLLDHLRSEPADLRSLAYTLQVGRESMKERLGVVVRSVDQLADKLGAFLAERGAVEGLVQGRVSPADNAVPPEFESEAALERAVNDWMASRELANLLDLWTRGVDLDWKKLHDGASPQCLRLPTYPFAKERYWVTPAAAPVREAVSAVASVVEARQAEPAQTLRYVPTWKASALQDLKDVSATEGALLVVGEDEALARAMRSRDGWRSGAVIHVRFGDRYAKLDRTGFMLDADRAEHFTQLLSDLASQGQSPRWVLHSARQGDESANPTREASIMFSLCKALVESGSSRPVNIVSLCEAGSGLMQPLTEALAGFYKTLALENPAVRGKVVTVVAGTSPEVQALLLDSELRESRWTTDVRYEHDRRSVKTWTEWTPDAVALKEMPIREGGAYVISGGLGGLGFIVAEHLARNFKARLVLLGRSSLDADLQQKITQLKALDGEVLYQQADVANPHDVQAAITTAKARFSRIDGVIHSAGIKRDAFILKKTREEFDAVVRAKVLGAIHLDEATRSEPLDLFVLFSSVASVAGNAGQADYAYANHVLDSLAQHRHALCSRGERHGRTLSINWPYWAEGGMSLSAQDVELMQARTGMHPLPTQEGLRCWEELLKSPLTQGVVLHGTASTIRAQFADKAGSTVRHAAPTATQDLPALQDWAEGWLKAQVGEHIRLAPEHIDSRERLEAFGIDSIVIGRINVSLEAALGELPKTLFYEHETIADLAGYLVRERHDALLSLRNEASPATAAPTTPAEPAGVERVADAASGPAIAEPIAIIGQHGLYPKSRDLDAFWAHLRQGDDLIDIVPPTRWDAEALYDADPERAADGKIYCKWGGFLDDFDKFDADFFNVPAAEAKVIDPQERLFLQSVWSAFEDAGYTRERLKKQHPRAKSAAVGVFVGVTTNSYQMLAGEGVDGHPASLPWSIANRVSYFFDLQGPSLAVDTACSSSLVALHLACESLAKGDCEVAVAGGVNLYLHPSKYQSFCERRMVSGDGKTHSFGSQEDGFVPSEGVGSLVLKPLSRAIADGDTISAVIRGSGWTHSGRANGYSAPNPNSNADLISQTLRRAGVSADTIGYVEGHGTGTQLGDSLEVVALTNAFRRDTSRQQFCAIGSVKSNIGHPEAAAGVAGIAKIVQQFRHEELVPTLHSEAPNPGIDFASSPFYLQHSLSRWEASGDHPRRALINSFGSGGVASCVVLEEYRQAAASQPHVGPCVFVLSARNAERLQEQVQQMRSHLQAHQEIGLADLCYTLQTGREAMAERLAIVATRREELLGLLERASQGETAPGLVRGTAVQKAQRRDEPLIPDGSLDASQWHALAQAWVGGATIDWDALHRATKPRRVSAPTYPFAKDRHWVREAPARAASLQAASTQPLHPLIGYNASTLTEVSFRSWLSDRAYYAQEHQVHGQKLFPGSGFIEMACIAGSIVGGAKVRKVQDIVWAQPLSLEQGGQTAQITLMPLGTDEAEYVITSRTEDDEVVVHSEGKVCFQTGGKEPAAHEETLDIRSLKQACTQSLDPQAFYALTRQYGFDYGPAFQTISQLHLSEAYALSRLELAEHVRADFEHYILHPCLVDGALQTVSALVGTLEKTTPYIPFAIGEVEIVRAIPECCWVHVERADGNRPQSADVLKFNVRIVTEGGHDVVRIKDFCVRAFAGAMAHGKEVLRQSA